MRFARALCLPFLVLAACGDQSAAKAHAFAGNWAEVLPGGKRGMTLEVDGSSDKVMVHTAPAADGTHDHISGTYTFDAVAKTVMVKAKLSPTGKADSWSGRLDGETLELSSADGKLTFKPGGDAHH